MRFFTIDRWIADQDWRSTHDPNAALRAYHAYLDGVRGRLPADFRRLLETIALHDARLRELTVEIVPARVVLRLDAADLTMREDRRVRLVYDGVTGLNSTSDPEKGLPGPHGYGDLGNDEIEVLPDGSYEHRMLFSTGIELSVRFGAFRLEVPDGGMDAANATSP
jgi:hypothetical protein